LLLERLILFAVCNNTFSKWWEGWMMSCRRVLSNTPLLVRVRKPVETAGKGSLQTRTYKQEIQLIQVARIGQAGRGASIDAGACGLVARRMRRWVHWGVHWCEHCNGSWIGRFLLWLLVFEGHCGWRNLIRTRGHPLLVARLWIENVLKFQRFNWMLYSRVECRRIPVDKYFVTHQKVSCRTFRCWTRLSLYAPLHNFIFGGT
jgi:hypothetical protein